MTQLLGISVVARKLSARPSFIAVIVLTVQVSVAIALIAATYFFQKSFVLSVGWGCLVGILANLFFARRLFAFSGAQQARNIVRGLYWGAAGKLLIVVSLFWLAFAKLPLMKPLPLLLAFVIMQIAHAVAPLLFDQRVFKKRSLDV